jgi:hypothetical protein
MRALWMGLLLLGVAACKHISTEPEYDRVFGTHYNDFIPGSRD